MIPAIPPTLVMCHLLLALLTSCSVTLAQAVFQISVDNEVQHFFRFSSVSISIHSVLRIATVEAGSNPALGVTFHQPHFYTTIKPSNSSPEAIKPAGTRFALALCTGGITVIVEHDGTGKQKRFSLAHGVYFVQ